MPPLKKQKKPNKKRRRVAYKMKVAIYVRVSTDKQDLTKQLEICKQHCQVKGYEVFDIYQDVISGKSESRPEFNRLLNDMRHYRFRGIVVSKLDRIGRSLKHLLSLFDEFTSKKVEFIAVTQNIDTTTPAGKLQLQILGAFAEFERNLISERTKEGLKHSKKKHLIGKRGRDKKPRRKRGVLRKGHFSE